MTIFHKYCQLLSIDGVVNLKTVKAAYRKLMFEWHPDRHLNRESYSLAHRKAQEINQAYEYLSELVENGEIPGSAATGRTYTRHRTRHTYRKTSFGPGFPDPSVFEFFVKSSHIVSIGYAFVDRMLYIKFEGGYVYRYHEVPHRTFEDFMRAPSHGRFANRHIYYEYEYERCEDWERPAAIP